MALPVSTIPIDDALVGRNKDGRRLFTASQIATPGEGATNMREATAMDDCYDVYNRHEVKGEQQMMTLL